MSGTWQTQDETRPGVYINVKNAELPTNNSLRGKVLLPLHLPWGDTTKPFVVTSKMLNKNVNDYMVGTGLSSFDTRTKLIKTALLNATEVIIVPMSTSGGAKATGAFTNQGAGGNVTVTFNAKHKGETGNLITISVVETSSKFDLVTTVLGVEVDRQRLEDYDTFVDNGWFSVSATAGTTLKANAGVTLTSGTDCAKPTLTEYIETLNKLKVYGWNTLAAVKTDVVTEGSQETFNKAIQTYINNERNVEGNKVQAVVYQSHGHNHMDSEGVIAVCQSVSLNNLSDSVEFTLAYVAGVTAKADSVTSNTYFRIQGATDVSPNFDNNQIERLLGKGFMLLSRRSDGEFVIEKDINSLQTFTAEKSYDFSKNRVLRVLDTLSVWITTTFENQYIGKVSNTDSGRALFKGSIIGYLNTMQQIEAIDSFDAQKDVEVLPGNDKESVVVNLNIKPVDSMEKLYVTIVIN